MLNNLSMYASIPVRNLPEAMDFYGDVLGLTIVDQNPNGVWYQSGDTRIAVFESEGAGSNKSTAAIFEVAQPEKIVKVLEQKGVVFEKYEIPGVKRTGVIHTVGPFRTAWFKDPSGNIIAIGSHL